MLGYLEKIQTALAQRGLSREGESADSTIGKRRCVNWSETSMSMLNEGGRQKSPGGSPTKEEQPFVSKSKSLPEEAVVGTLLPLECGHNGVLSPDEIRLYERQLMRAGFV